MNYKIHDNIYNYCYLVGDVVRDELGSIGVITKTYINSSQDTEDNQLSYSVEWGHLENKNTRNSWWSHRELTPHFINRELFRDKLRRDNESINR